MYGTFYLALSALLAIATVRRTTIVSPAAIWNVYLFISLVVYEAVVLTNLSTKESAFSIMPLTNIEMGYHRTFLFFLMLQILAYSTSIGLPKPKNWLSFDSSSILFRYAAHVSGGAAVAVMIVFWLLSAIHLSLIDLDVLWMNYEYKAIKDPVKIGATDPFSRFYHFAFRIVGLLGMALAVFYFHRRALLQWYLAAGLAVYALIFLLADNSRWVPVYFACAAAVNFVVSRRPLGFGTWLNIALTFITFAKVLVGRNRAMQGVASIADGFLALNPLDMGHYLRGFMINVFPAAISFANSVIRSDMEHGLEYKLKSFSPLLGGMDNFEAARLTYQIKLHAFVPMGAFGEVYMFGAAFTVVFLAGCFFWLRGVTRLLLYKFDGTALIFMILSMYMVLRLPSYSVRTSWRLVLIVAIVSYIVHHRRVAAYRARRAKRVIKRPARNSPIGPPRPRIRTP